MVEAAPNAGGILGPPKAAATSLRGKFTLSRTFAAVYCHWYGG